MFEQFWGLIALLVCVVLYRETAFSFAKQKAAHLMLIAEKRAEEFLLETGRDKFEWVVEKGYSILPAVVKMFISYKVFRIIVQELFDAAIDYAEKNRVTVEKK